MKMQEGHPGAPAKRTATSIDVFLLFADHRGIRHLCWDGLSTYRLPADAGRHPSRIVRDAVVDLGLTPRFIHSTSWRFEDGAVVLTYAAVVDPPTLRARPVSDRPIEAGSIARGDAFDPPRRLETAEVLAHTMRHLAWLVRDDPRARSTMERWEPHLRGFQPEPFQGPGDAGQGAP